MDSSHFIQLERKTGWSKELLYQLVENVTEYAIFVSDLDGKIVSWNVGAEKVFGYPAKEAIGQHCSMLFTREDRDNNEPEKERKIAREDGSAKDERWHLRRDGSLFFASGVQMPLYDETGTHTGYAKIARDLTERVTLQEALQEAQDNLEVKIERRTAELNESNESLRTEVTRRAESERTRVALLRKIVRTQEDERKRIARDIHDHIGQQIIGLKLHLQLLRADCPTDSKLNEKITVLQSIAEKIDAEADFLAWELRPSVLDDLGLATAIENFTKEWSVHFQIQAGFHQNGLDGKRLLPEIEINLYRICQEALNNICKHARAKNVSVLLEHRAGKILLLVEDDGVGFDPGKKAVITNNDRGMGLLGMKERAELIGGTIEIESSIGNGTTIFVRVPARFEKTKNNQKHNAEESQ
jgi:PAS domain S-box-containing protein